MQNKIEKYESPTALIEESQNCEQRPILLEIDWDSEVITAYTHERNWGTPARIWHGLASTYTLDSNVDATELAEWVQTEIVPIAEKLLTAFSAEWDGSNRVGRWAETVATGEDVSQLDREIEELCYDDREVPTIQGESPGLRDIREWVDLQDGELTADSTDTDIERLAKEIERTAKSEYVVLCGPDLREWLAGKRDEMRE